MKSIINLVFPYLDFLYLLQLEEYDGKRYLRLLRRFFHRRNFQKRQKLVITSRIKTTLIVSIIITFVGVAVFSVLTIALIPIWIFIANLILDPTYSKIKARIREKASKYFSENFKGKVVAVAGSYGKTTTKNYIYDLVRFNYKTQMIPGNINTPTGIANWIMKNLNKSTEILIVEMDTYFIGEIKQSCQITPPDIAVLTNVGDQHLERFATRKNLEEALREVFEYAKPEAIKIENKNSNLDYAVEVAKALGIPNDIIKDTTKNLKKPDRRGDVKTLYGFETIDESYNISFTTAKTGLQNALKLAKQKKKKLIVITGGIPELGIENKTANTDYGELLSKSDVEVILLKTILYGEVLKGLKETPLLADSMDHAWEVIKEKFDSEKYIVLMQPELGDQYY